jgi:hypothetical protein
VMNQTLQAAILMLAIFAIIVLQNEVALLL